MVHLFRPQDPAVRPTPPVGTWSTGQWSKLVGRVLAHAADLAHWRPLRLTLAYLLIGAGVVAQLVLLLVAAYLVDLSISLMELWAQLARKHLELTMS